MSLPRMKESVTSDLGGAWCAGKHHGPDLSLDLLYKLAQDWNPHDSTPESQLLWYLHYSCMAKPDIAFLILFSVAE